jgi:hypothetical protein
MRDESWLMICPSGISLHSKRRHWQCLGRMYDMISQDHRWNTAEAAGEAVTNNAKKPNSNGAMTAAISQTFVILEL